MAKHDGHVTGGVDTHADTHTAAVVDEVGRLLDSREFRADPAGYRALLRWMRRFGAVQLVGVEGTGSYGAGLARFLMGVGVVVVEVDRPDRKARRAHGKSDPIDAEAAARAALSERAGAPYPRQTHDQPSRPRSSRPRSHRDARAVPPEQDRGPLDTSLIAGGVAILHAALARDQLGEYQVQAAIAALLADALTAEETDWVQIVEWYDELLRLADIPIVRLNRAVAIGEADGAPAGLNALSEGRGRRPAAERGRRVPVREERRARPRGPPLRHCCAECRQRRRT